MLFPKSLSSEPRFFVVRSASGQIVRSGTVSESMIQMQCGEGETAQIEGAAEEWAAHMQALANPVLTLAQRKEKMLSKLAEKRWQVECAGTTLGGSFVATDDRSKLLITGAYQQALANPQYSTRWKSGAGEWVTLDAQTIIAVYGAVFSWVQACFAREGDLSDLVQAVTTEEQAAQMEAAIASFWPATN